MSKKVLQGIAIDLDDDGKAVVVDPDTGNVKSCFGANCNSLRDGVFCLEIDEPIWDIWAEMKCCPKNRPKWTRVDIAEKGKKKPVISITVTPKS